MTEITSQYPQDDRPDYRVVILGAGKSMRGHLPSALVSLNKSMRVIDWHLDLFSLLPSADIVFVAGYMAEAIQEQYPSISFLINPNWHKTGPIQSLSQVPFTSKVATYICYVDVLIRKNIIGEMEQKASDVVLAVDTGWVNRYEAASQLDLESKEKVAYRGARIFDCGSHVALKKAQAQFSGLMRIAANRTGEIGKLLKTQAYSSDSKLSVLIKAMIQKKYSIATVDTRDNWTELDAPQDLAKFILGTKAESLDRLRKVIKKGTIDEQICFSQKEWNKGPARIIGKIQNAFSGNRLIVRSSAYSEDTWRESLAGAYKSILNIDSKNGQAIRKAVDNVFASYAHSRPVDQVLVQEMLKNVRISGVVMTRTPTLGAPYYVFNFDDYSSRTDTVTSGKGKFLRTVYLSRSEKLNADFPVELNNLLEAIKEIEDLVGYDSLDVEFAITREGAIHILQVRPIGASFRAFSVDDTDIYGHLNRARNQFRQLQQPNSALLGKSTFLSNMADWNPAEMIGVKPNRLAFSLYRYLITDSSWAKQRAEFGYRDVRPQPLIVDVLGQPYVDIRVDFNSFIPAKLPVDIASGLIEYYMKQLKVKPQLHDKVEFEILFTCLTFDFDERIKALDEFKFTKSEVNLLRENLLEITLNGIRRCADDLAQIKNMDSVFAAILCEGSPLERAALILKEIRNSSIPLFSHLARNAFIAISLLKSLVAKNLITSEQVEQFLYSLETISSVMQRDAQRVLRNELRFKDFVEIYGHLRPGSYDITSFCYAQDAERFLRPMIKVKPAKRREDNPWDEKSKDVIVQELMRSGFNITFDEFDQYLRTAIEGREMAKFIFMRHLNTALELIYEFGSSYGLLREDLAQVCIEDFFGFIHLKKDLIADRLVGLANDGKEKHKVTQTIVLPSQIHSEEDFLCMELAPSEANFITQKKAKGAVASLTCHSAHKRKLSGKIIVLPSADPGFDWIFSQDIIGIITLYGGANSHMAIRAAEFQLPAAIGVGELLFEKINQAEFIELDCLSKSINVIR